jgi:hypothetical protein
MRTYDGYVATPFAFRMRAYAATHFDWDDVLTVTWPDAEANLQSEYTGGDDGRAYPVTIHGEIRGQGESLEEAEPRLAAMIGNTLPLIALASNAAVADPLAVAAYGLDLTEPQPFVGYRTPSAGEWFPPGKRRIDADATHDLMRAVGRSPHGDLLLRAIEAYRRALGHWIPEQRLLAGEFLFIASETLSRFMIESRAASRGMTPSNLAQLMKAKSSAALRHQYLRDEIFDGDEEAFEAVEKASNGFEHGYMAVDEVRGLLEPVLERSMGHLRRAVIAASGIEPEFERRLLADNYAEPRGLVPAIPVVFGQLSCQDPAQPLPLMAGAVVELEWNTPVPIATRTAAGDVNLSFPWTITAKLPPNAKLDVSRFGLRAAYLQPTDEPLQVEVSRAEEATPAQAPEDAHSR